MIYHLKFGSMKKFVLNMFKPTFCIILRNLLMDKLSRMNDFKVFVIKKVKIRESFSD